MQWEKVNIPRVKKLLGKQDDKMASAYKKQHEKEHNL